MCFGIEVACASNEDIKEKNFQQGYPIADGTFIQDNLIAKWTDARWQQELAALKEAGMHYIVFAPTLHSDANGYTYANYPCNIPNVKPAYASNLVENCLRNAQKAGFKVFLGLNFHERWWNFPFPAEWLCQQMEIGNKVADDLVKRYKKRYGEVMYGWYWVWEVDNVSCTTPEREDVLIKALNINLDHVHAITPSMPFMLCPYMNYRLGSASDCRKMWEYVFAGSHFQKGDIFAPQDCVGAGGLDLDHLNEWFSELHKAVLTKSELLFWSDAETFDQRFWTSATIDRLVQQMKIVQPYVSNVITFAYSHYDSPFYVNENFHKAYLHYVRSGELPVDSQTQQAVQQLNIRSDADKKNILEWVEPASRENVAGYYIYRNEVLIGNVQTDHYGNCKTEFVDRSLVQSDCRYGVCSYNWVGTTSPVVYVNRPQ